VIPEAPFLFSIAGLSASLAGLAGLVVGLRRGSDMSTLDAYRLRQIVEFSFANIIFAIGIIPLAVNLGDPDVAVRIGAAAALLYSVANGILLIRRSRLARIHWTPGWTTGVLLIDGVLVLLAIAAAAVGRIALYEALLVMLLIRPMFAFLLVMAGLGSRPEPGTGGG
jgi:hypothetical protein